MSDLPKISPMGDRGILIKFEEKIEPELLERVLSLKKIIENHLVKQKVEVTNTYNSLLISYMFTIKDIYDEISALKKLLGDVKIPKISNTNLYYLPVCYETEFGLDLEIISKENGLEIQEIIRLHTEPIYQLYFLGFLPGFLYLGGLDKRLQISRKETPRRSVEKGSVGIGENQTGIYPKTSPGGWQILGRCPVELFDKNSEEPSPFKAGDKIKFYSVSKAEYLEIERQIKTGNFQLKKELYEG
ncbi:5-oxoprolinase subunit PxpB [Christiangramia salexigens]|uniref:Allophanate hydrolase n=1 Tax=Christiangramia salexigens TaxID=1913577 RepID=A0A1L3J252_9FLAO|nr:5-oxoprolinase subunit PxpB [Christiangramia salexigens]APG59193.1 allophanate hydrolase [Christiangramia salexigens]